MNIFRKDIEMNNEKYDVTNTLNVLLHYIKRVLF